MAIDLSTLQQQHGSVSIADPTKIHVIFDPPRDDLRRWARATLVYIDGDRWWTIGYVPVDMSEDRQVIPLRFPSNTPAGDPT